MNILKKACALMVLALMPCVLITGADSGHHHAGGGPHWKHSLFVESPAPDTKIMISGMKRRFGEHRMKMAGAKVEWSPMRSGSLELSLPYKIPGEGGASWGEINGGVKLMSLVLEKDRFVFGGGLKFAYPLVVEKNYQGSQTNPKKIEWTPFVDFGWIRGKWQVVAFALLHGMGANEGKFRFEMSWMRNLSSRFDIALEVLSAAPIHEGRVKGTRFSAGPSLFFWPWGNQGLMLVFGFQKPTDALDNEDLTGKTMLMWHF